MPTWPKLWIWSLASSFVAKFTKPWKATSDEFVCDPVCTAPASARITYELPKLNKKSRLAAVPYLGFFGGSPVSYVCRDFLLSSSRFNTTEKPPTESCPGSRRVCAFAPSDCRRMNDDEASPSVTAGRSRVWWDSELRRSDVSSKGWPRGHTWHRLRASPSRLLPKRANHWSIHFSLLCSSSEGKSFLKF